MNKELKRALRYARRAGARVEHGKKHVKVYDGAELVVILPHGRNRDRTPGGSVAGIRKAWERKGWRL